MTTPTTPAEAADIVERRCGLCGFPIHPSEGGLRNFGYYTAHSESRCRDIMLAEIEALRAREADLTASLMATAEASATHLDRATELQAAISDPVSVHVNMLRGSIAKPQPESIWHLYGESLLDAMPTEFRDRLDAELQKKLDVAVGWLRYQSAKFQKKAEASVCDRANERLSRDLFAAKISLSRAADAIERGDHLKESAMNEPALDRPDHP